MAEVGMGTLYDFNKAAMENEPKMSKKVINNKINELTKYFYDKSSNNYFLLLCNEEKYYTVFHFSNRNEANNNTAAKDVIECMQNYGTLLSIEPAEDGIAYEIWARSIIDKTIHCFYLFPYDNGVIEY